MPRPVEKVSHEQGSEQTSAAIGTHGHQTMPPAVCDSGLSGAARRERGRDKLASRRTRTADGRKGRKKTHPRDQPRATGIVEEPDGRLFVLLVLGSRSALSLLITVIVLDPIDTDKVASLLDLVD